MLVWRNGRSALVFVSIFLITLFLWTNGQAAEQKPKKIKLVHVAAGNYGDHWVQMVSGLESMSKELGIVDLVTLEGQLKVQRHLEVLENALSMKPDVIFVDHGEAKALDPVIEKAINANIKVIVFDLATSVKRITANITQDDYMLAYKGLSMLAEDIQGEGKVVTIHRVGSAPLERRARIIPLMLERFPGIKILAEVPTQSGMYVQSVMDNLGAILTANPSKDAIQAIWAPFDQFAIGACKALETAKRNIPVYSIDVSPYDLQLMAAPGSPWKATAACDPVEIGRLAVRAAVASAVFGLQVPKNVQLPAVLITQEKARSLGKGQYLNKKIVPEWGDSGLIWPKQLQDLVKDRKN